MKPPPLPPPPLLLLLLLLVAGFVRCFPGERQEGGHVKDSVAPLSVVDDSGGGSSLALSKTSLVIEDVDHDQQLNQPLHTDGGTGNNNTFLARSDLKKPTLAQTRGKREIKSPDMLSRSLRTFRYKKIPTRKQASRRHGNQRRSSLRGRSGQGSEGYAAGDYNDVQQEDENYTSNDENDTEMDEEEDYGEDDDDDDDDDGNEVADYDGEEKEEEVEEEDYQQVRRPPPKWRRWKPKRRNKYRKGRYRRDLEGHEDIKRGIKSKLRKMKILSSRNETKGTKSNETDTDTGYSDSDDDDETRPLLRSQRKNWKKASSSSGRNNRYAANRDITKRGFFSKIKKIFKRKKLARSNAYKKHKDYDEPDDDGGDSNYGYDRSDDDPYEDEDTYYDDTSDERAPLLPGKRKIGFLGFSKRYRNKRGDLNILERVLRNFALLSSHLKDNTTQNITTPPLGTLEEDQAKEDEGENYEDNEDENEAKGREYEDDDENEGEGEEDGREDAEYDGQDDENDLGDEYEDEGEENGNEMSEYDTQNGEYDAWDKQNGGQKDKYERKSGGRGQDDDYKGLGEDKGGQVGDYEIQSDSSEEDESYEYYDE